MGNRQANRFGGSEIGDGFKIGGSATGNSDLLQKPWREKARPVSLSLDWDTDARALLVGAFAARNGRTSGDEPQHGEPQADRTRAST